MSMRHHSKKFRKHMVGRARKLRNQETGPESKLWSFLRDRGLGGMKFRRQHVIGQYVVDFYCAQLSLVIELDGESHDEIAYPADVAREDWLLGQGYTVLRFENDEVLQNLDAVLDAILEVAENLEP